MAEVQFWVGIHGIIANRGRILVLRRAPAMTYKPGCWDLPGGHLALGESFDGCLLREVKEETGLDVAIERLIGLHKVDADLYLQALYACRLMLYQPIRLRPNEHAESRWVTLAEAAELELIPYLEAVLKLGMLNYTSAALVANRTPFPSAKDGPARNRES
jgi:8-oxo-dGTP pyrophosphatase MutT (NUDIX family)